MEALTLHELNGLVRGTLENVLNEEYWLQAELSEVREAYNGHCYLEFIEKDKSGRDLIAKARGTIWANIYRLLKPMFERETGRPFASGLKVLVKVSVAFHELYGYSLTVSDIDPTYTLGDMARQRREILERLSKEGILNDNKNLCLPLFANKIAVISSSNAAGYGDFCDQLLNNEYGLSFHVRLFPAIMQGASVEPSILDALDAILNDTVKWDAVVIIRGGGATSDLSGFDTYLLAAACAQFPIPIITGIGHERDDTVIDLVSHLRVKTPTAAAAFLINHQQEIAVRLDQIGNDLARNCTRCLEQEKVRLERLAVQSSVVVKQVRSQAEHRMDLLLQRLEHSTNQFLVNSTHKIEQTGERLNMILPTRIERARQRLLLLEKTCEAADPAILLKRGYSMTFCNGELLKNVTDIKSGDEIITRLAEGEVHSIVT